MSRPLCLDQMEVNELAEGFVQGLGSVNAKFLRENLHNVEASSDALRGLKRALDNDFYSTTKTAA